MAKKRYYGNESLGLVWDQIGVCQVALLYTTYHLFPCFISNFLHGTQQTFFPNLSWRFLYWFPLTASKSKQYVWYSLYIAYTGGIYPVCPWNVLLLIEFVTRACSWAAQIKLYVSSFNSPGFYQCHLLFFFSFPQELPV